MKKFTSFMLMLLCAVTTWAGPTDLPQITTDVNNPIYYTIMNTRSSQPGGYMYFAGENVGLKDEQVATIENKHKFYFTGNHEALYVHNAATNLKLASVGSWTAAGTAWAVAVSPKGGGLAFGPQGGLNGNSCWNEKNYTTDANTSDFTTWSANDDGSIFLVALAEDCEIKELAYYTIEAPLFEQVQGVKKGLVVDAEGALGWNTIDLTNKNCYWIPTNVDRNTIALKNLGTGKFLNGTGLSDESVDATVKVLGQAQYNIVSNGTTVHANNHGGGSNASGNIVSWGGAANSASAWQFVEQQDPDAVEIDITYNFTYKGESLVGYTQTVKTVTGTEYPNITVSFPFGVSATKPEGTIAKEDAPAKTVTIEVEEALPFKYAADASSIKNWYYIQQHSSAGYGKYLQYAETYIEWADATIAANEVDTYTWAFVGDPFDGFKMVNYGAPEGANAVVSNGSGNPSFGAFNDATAWNIKVSATNNDAEHFCFQYPGSNQYMNAQSGKIAFWSSADQGSTMWVTERDMTGTADLQALIDQVDAILTTVGNGGTTVGYYTVASVGTLNTALTAAKEAVADEDRTLESNTAAMTALQVAKNALVTVQPTEGAFYYIASAMPSTDGRSGQKMYVNNAGGMQFQNAETLANVFQFVPAGDNTFYLYNVERGTYLNTNKGHNGGQAEAKGTEGTVKVAIANMGRENVVSIIPNGGAMLHAQAAGSQVVAWNNNDNAGASAWIISEVEDITALSHTLTVGDAGYATLCLGYNATIPAIEGNDNGVFVVSELEEGKASMTKVEGVLPANTAVIVKATADTYDFNYATGEPTKIEANELKGTTIEKNFTEAAYVLGIVEGEVGLYTATKNQQEGAAWKNNAFKAYLPKAEGMNAVSYSFSFDWNGTTGIENIDGTAEKNAVESIYDITGRKINSITVPGIYIINGKKTFVK